MLGLGSTGPHRGLMPILEDHLVQGNSNRADLGAASTQGRGLAQVLVLIKVLEVRGDHFPDGTGIGGPVAMPPDVLVNRASIQAGSATDAMQGLPGLGIFEQASAAVIQKDDHHFLGAIAFVFPSWSMKNGVISGHLLTGAFGR